MIRPSTCTQILAVDYLDEELVALTLGRPNITVQLSADESKQPWVVEHRIKNQWGGRHQCFGPSFTDLTRGRRQTHWQKLLEEAPLGVDGIFHSIDGTPHNLDEVLKNGSIRLS